MVKSVLEWYKLEWSLTSKTFSCSSVGTDMLSSNNKEKYMCVWYIPDIYTDLYFLCLNKSAFLSPTHFRSWIVIVGLISYRFSLTPLLLESFCEMKFVKLLLLPACHLELFSSGKNGEHCLNAARSYLKVQSHSFFSSLSVSCLCCFCGAA